MKDMKPAEAFAPGEYLRDELQARGWSQGQFARILGRPVQLVNKIVNGRKRITEQTALEIAAALGTSARVWLNLETSYRLWKAKPPARVAAIVRRAKRASAA
jgi:HTH-type transcriptional regulator/antitoxin HigA